MKTQYSKLTIAFVVVLGLTTIIILVLMGVSFSIEGSLTVRPKKMDSFPRACLCGGKDVSLVNSVPKDQINQTLKRRAEEYRKHQIRMNANLDVVLIAPSNSPLQYPSHGFTVEPLTKSLIPGLAVHAQKRALYKVSLSVSSGVLSVESTTDMDLVEGQGQNKLNISTQNVTQLNQLLSQVSYTSTIYHIKTRDLARFIFEDNEVMFPIIIKRTSMPVLYDPGTDVNSQVTVTTKTFLRYKELNVLIESIRKYYKDIKIIIADDSLNPERVNGSNIEHYIMPPAQGWFAGRNLAVSQVTTKYFLWVDDDFQFTSETKIESFVEIMEAVPELDIVGGAVGKNTFYFKLVYEEGDINEGGCLSRFFGKRHQPLPGYPDCSLVDGVVNFFLARTDSVRRVGFDPQLKRVAHSEFFMDGLGDLLIASCGSIRVGHQPKVDRGKYNQYRMPGKSEKTGKLALHFFKNHLKCVRY
ncbi:beta-1,4 N-acetylgalactosaminyltransferase 2-like [Chanos chanos]|uniref:Beta-1,4 N-acetylgalactosaminyltransferase 2-like n=1 Tax=Chanos chanos TaxID=29144 RepID=A0A6J2WXV3_CHACN|nr:beta-1,4 N-acetylgalactosaminyltransferase 2-like [Chanos chanos]